MSQASSHENLNKKQDVKSGSEKSFGVVFAVVFSVIGFWPLLADMPIRIWALLVALILIIIAFVMPNILKPFNRLWFLFGLMLHKIVSPVIMGLIFFLTVTPIAFMMRFLGKRPLPLEFDPNVESYWIERDPPGPERETMKRQF